jgi:glycosyltransferase involved in cell wall biosynthesis
VLFVGSLFQRRRIDVLIDAFARVAAAHPDAHLDIVGENRTVPRVDYAAQVAALGLGARVSVRHWVDDETLSTLYAEASAFAFLSEYEGFGFTPLEALAHGAVPVVLDTPVAREIYGEAAVRVADGPALVDELAAALSRLLIDPSARTPYLAAAPPVLASYRWADTAARTWRALEEAAGA